MRVCNSRGVWLTLLAVVAIAACGAAEKSVGVATAADGGGVPQGGRKADGSQLTAAAEQSDAAAAASAGTGMSGHVASAGNHEVSGGTGADTAGSANNLGSAGWPAAVGGAGAAAAVGGAGATTAVGGAGATAAGSGGGPAAQTGFTLVPVGLEKANDTELAFPADAINTVSISPELMWSNVPPNAKSLALVFRDLSMSIVKWIVWDIPPTVTDLPKGISQDSQMLKEIPGAMQLGALGHQGYYGPCCTANHYEWVLWALDDEKLPVSPDQTTETIRDTIIAAHQLASTPPVLMRRVTP